MMETLDLSPLRGVHFPPDPSWFPPAPVWWLIALLLFACAGAWLLMRTRSQASQRRQAILQRERTLRTELESLRASSQRNPAACLQSINAWLKHYTLTHLQLKEPLTLHGQAWTQWLDEPFQPHSPFTEGPGVALKEWLYHPHPRVEADALIDLCLSWAEKVNQVEH